MHLRFIPSTVACAVLTAEVSAQTPPAPVPLLQAVSSALYSTLPVDQRQFYVAWALD